jgi:hypothetical protein
MRAEINPVDYQFKLNFLWSEAGKKKKHGHFKATSSDDIQPQKRKRIFNLKSRANRECANQGAGRCRLYLMMDFNQYKCFEIDTKHFLANIAKFSLPR